MDDGGCRTRTAARGLQHETGPDPVAPRCDRRHTSAYARSSPTPTATRATNSGLAGSVFRARVNVASGVTTFHVLPSTDTARVRSSLSATWTSAPLFVGHRTWGPQAIVSVAVPALEGARTGCRSRRRPAVLCRARNASRRSPLDRPPEGSAARSARGGCVGLTGGQVAPRQSRVRVGRQSHQSDTRNMRLATHPASGLSSNLRRDHSCRPIPCGVRRRVPRCPTGRWTRGPRVLLGRRAGDQQVGTARDSSPRSPRWPYVDLATLVPEQRGGT